MSGQKGIISFYLLLLSFASLAQADINDLLDKTDSFFSKNVSNGYVNYDQIIKDQDISILLNQYQELDYLSLKENTQKALLINAYNLQVIELITQDYPLLSVKAIPRFFQKDAFKYNGKKISLNELEKKHLLNRFDDPRLHFALVCGAKGCPPLLPFAYRPELLDTQLDEATRSVLNNPYFVRLDNDKVHLFKVLEWYSDDFTSNNTSLVNYINEYRDIAISQNAIIEYRKYDWSLNALVDDLFGGIKAGNNSLRYIVSSTIPKGGIEIKWFNNLYSQTANENRSTFFTSSLNALYGLNDRFNIGATGRLRRVRNQSGDSSPFDLFKSLNPENDRQEISGIGPMIRWAPVPKWTNFSIQSSILIPLDSDLSGSQFSQPYVDYDGAIWTTQFFNDFTLGKKFSLFTEVDFLLENIKGEHGATRKSLPITTILSYFPFKNATIYGLASYSRYFETPSDYFYQYGIGSKYQFTPNYEMELLYTQFDNKDLSNVDGSAATYNIGIRYSY